MAMMPDLPPWVIAWGFAIVVCALSAVVAAIALYIEKDDPL